MDVTTLALVWIEWRERNRNAFDGDKIHVSMLNKEDSKSTSWRWSVLKDQVRRLVATFVIKDIWASFVI